MSTSTYRDDHPQRLFAEIALRPFQGARFQPARYANLGPAVFTTPDGVAHLQVDGHAAVANWLEAVGWDDGAAGPVPPLEGIPYVRVEAADGTPLTTSRTDSHRLASAYVLDARLPDGTEFRKHLVGEMGLAPKQPIDWPRVAGVCFRYDPLSLLHGVFFSQSGKSREIPGNPKFTRIASAFVEAHNVVPASRGGVRFDRVDPSTVDRGGQSAETGYGHVPLPISDDYTAETITLYWSLDLAGVATTRLPQQARDLLQALGLWQLRRLVDDPIKPRTFCDLQAEPPEGLPDSATLDQRVREAADRCRDGGLFADPPVTVVRHGAGA